MKLSSLHVPRLGVLLSSLIPFTRGPTATSCPSTPLTLPPLTPNLLGATIRIRSPFHGTIPCLTQGLLLNTSIVRAERQASSLSLLPLPNLTGMASTTKRGQAWFKCTKHPERRSYRAPRISAARNHLILTRNDRHEFSYCLVRDSVIEHCYSI